MTIVMNIFRFFQKLQSFVSPEHYKESLQVLLDNEDNNITQHISQYLAIAFSQTSSLISIALFNLQCSPEVQLLFANYFYFDQTGNARILFLYALASQSLNGCYRLTHNHNYYLTKLNYEFFFGDNLPAKPRELKAIEGDFLRKALLVFYSFQRPNFFLLIYGEGVYSIIYHFIAILQVYDSSTEITRNLPAIIFSSLFALYRAQAYAVQVKILLYSGTVVISNILIINSLMESLARKYENIKNVSMFYRFRKEFLGSMQLFYVINKLLGQVITVTVINFTFIQAYIVGQALFTSSNFAVNLWVAFFYLSCGFFEAIYNFLCHLFMAQFIPLVRRSIWRLYRHSVRRNPQKNELLYKLRLSHMISVFWAGNKYGFTYSSCGLISLFSFSNYIRYFVKFIMMSYKIKQNDR